MDYTDLKNLPVVKPKVETVGPFLYKIKQEEQQVSQATFEVQRGNQLWYLDYTAHAVY